MKKAGIVLLLLVLSLAACVRRTAEVAPTEKIAVTIAGGHGAEVSYFDQTSWLQPPTVSYLNVDQLTVRGFSVAVVTLPK